ncbi:MAG: hypothetical protein WC107_02145 [Patescibacteria group bacterium]
MAPLEQGVLSLSQTGFITANSAWQAPVKERDLNYSILNHRKTFESSLSSLFGDNQEESKIQKARAILGETAIDIPDNELNTYLTEFQYLLDEWLDEYEKQLFNGKTLQQLLREG